MYSLKFTREYFHTNSIKYYEKILNLINKYYISPALERVYDEKDKINSFSDHLR